MQEKMVKLAGHTGYFVGISEDDPYFLSFLVDDAESEFVDVCSSILLAGSFVIDIGANIGMKTFVMSKILAEKNGNGKVWSYEASPAVTAALKTNVTRNHLLNVTVENVAMSDRSGTASFFSNFAWGHINCLENP